MKKTLVLITALLYIGVSTAQTIDLDFANPAPEFQDADVGAIALGDIDNDGDLDFMSTGKGGPVLSTLYRNDGAGNFTEIIGTPFENVFAGTVRFEDVDNDDDLDLLITGSTSSPVTTAKLYLNDGDGNYSLVENTPFEPSEGGDFSFGDIDGDGDRDVIMTGYNGQGEGFTSLYLNDGTGTFSEETETPFPALKNSSVEFIDIDNDDDMDVILAGLDNQDFLLTALFINDGTGSFSLVADTPFENINSGDIAIADSDNDGDTDILISGQMEGNTAISNLYINDGTGTYSLVENTPFLGTFVGVSEFADFDKDGDKDILIIGASNPEVIAEIYENLGNNEFVLADELPGAYLSSMAIGDINGDEKLDVIIAGTSFTAPARSTKTYINGTPETVATDDLENIESLFLSPNPSKGILNVELEQGTTYTFQIHKVTGELVYSKEDLRNTNSSIPLDLPSGFYIATLQAENVILTQKLVIER